MILPGQAFRHVLQQSVCQRGGGGEAAGKRPEPVQQQVPAGCRRYSGHPCHGPEKKSKGARRSGSDMRRMFHCCIASGDDTRRSAGQGAVGSQWPVSEQRLNRWEGSAKSAVIRKHGEWMRKQQRRIDESRGAAVCFSRAPGARACRLTLTLHSVRHSLFLHRRRGDGTAMALRRH